MACLNQYINSIESIEKPFEISGSNGTIKLDTSEIDFLGKIYISIKVDNNQNKPFDITDYFNIIKFTFNGVESVISSQIALMILQISNTKIINDTLNKMYLGNPIYIPIKIFNEPIYVRNQNILIEIEGIVGNTNQITLIYDKCITNVDFVLLNEYQNMQIPLTIYTTCENKITGLVEILHIHDKLQEIFWIYKSKSKSKSESNQLIHPVSDISIKSDYGILLSEMNKIYFTYVDKYKWYSLQNPDLYSYSFIINPQQFNFNQGTQASAIKFIQTIKPEYKFSVFDNYSQIIVLKSVCAIKLI